MNIRGLQLTSRFQFTPPCGGGVHGIRVRLNDGIISIHAPVWGRALRWMLHGLAIATFQFTPPCGGGLKVRQIHIT